ncbi:hypothetical protein [Deinococcus sp.]|uniref:hypothetical protein n=1 Tax=Deinococcus sp. TaxID=47478 RepID=UPI003C7B82AC
MEDYIRLKIEPQLNFYLISKTDEPPSLSSESQAQILHNLIIEHRENICDADSLIIGYFNDNLENIENSSFNLIKEYGFHITESFIEEHGLNNFHNLDIYFFQQTTTNPSTATGVNGFYCRTPRPYQEGQHPFIAIFITPDYTERLLPTAFHELGHYIRNVKYYKSTGVTNISESIFQEGLCENLVEKVLGLGGVFHDKLPDLGSLIEIKTDLESYINDHGGRNDIKAIEFNDQYAIAYLILKSLRDRRYGPKLQEMMGWHPVVFALAAVDWLSKKIKELQTI